jgi:hypothetical protein
MLPPDLRPSAEELAIQSLCLDVAIEGDFHCKITGNMCGTDTRPVGRPCLCEQCEAHEREFQKRLRAAKGGVA